MSPTTFGDVTPTGVAGIDNVRQRLVDVLAPDLDEDPQVHSSPIDALVAPAIIVGWRDPMIEGWGACTAMANLYALIVADRMDIASGYEVIEQQYQRCQTLLRNHGWGIVTDSGIGEVDIAKVPYLSVRLDVRCPIAL